MEMSSRARSFEKVVLVADVLNEETSLLTGIRRDLELTDQATLEALCAAIASLGAGVVHYGGPDKLARNADRHKHDVVLTIYGGQGSRSRMALVPAICESFGLKFIGPDAYGRIIAQDKEVSKRLARDCGLSTPRWRVIRAAGDLGQVRSFSYPAVVKPLLEGSSIGITQQNLARTAAEAERVAKSLLQSLQQPVLIEDFVAGREVALVAIAAGGDMQWAYTEVFVEGDPKFFEDRLFDASEKLHRSPGRSVRNIDSELASEDLEQIGRLLNAFGKFGYCRVDGRLAGGKFHFLELTPDAWIDPRGQFAMGFTERGWTYEQVIEAVLSSAD